MKDNTMIKKTKSFDQKYCENPQDMDKFLFSMGHQKKNSIIFFLLSVQCKGDSEQILKILKSFYQNDLISINDLLEFNSLVCKNTVRSDILRTPSGTVRSHTVRSDKTVNQIDFNPNYIVPYICNTPMLKTETSRQIIKSKQFHPSFPEHFQMNRILGEGDFGKVYRVKHQIDGQQYALKKMHFHQANQDDVECCLNEIQVLATLQHENIVRYHCSFFEKDTLYIQIELCDMTLNDAMLQSLKLSRKVKYVFEILNGLHYLHQLQYIHFDMKPDNILIKNGVCKIADFGFTKLKHYCIGNDDVGCNIYSPSFILHSSQFVDIYALGVMTIELFLEEKYKTNMEKVLVMREVISNRNFRRLKGESKFNRLLEKFLIMCFSESTNTSTLMNFCFLSNKKYYKNSL